MAGAQPPKGIRNKLIIPTLTCAPLRVHKNYRQGHESFNRVYQIINFVKWEFWGELVATKSTRSYSYHTYSQANLHLLYRDCEVAMADWFGELKHYVVSTWRYLKS